MTSSVSSSGPSELSRRAVLAGLAGGAASIAGWSSLRRSWVTGAAAAAPGVSAVPPLDGTLETAPAVLADFAGDFGHLVTRTPTAVLRPGSVQDVVAMVRYARRHGLKVAVNGQGGTPDRRESHSNYGQATVAGGIAIDAKSLATIHSVGPAGADVDAGVSWASLVDAAAPAGLTPPVLTDLLHLSIGGTLSVGGLGGTIQRYGTQADNVVELQVVTGAGDLVTCSPSRNRQLFDAVLAGAGQCGLIVRAKVPLVPAETHVTVFNLYYDELDTFLADQLTLLDDGRFTHQEGQIVRRPDDAGWRYTIEAAAYYTPPAAPDREALLAGLSDDRASAEIVEQSYRDWSYRLDPGLEILKANGFWDQPKPWLTLLVPGSQASGYLERVVADLTPADLGAGRALLYPIATERITRPLFALPQPPEPVAFVFALLRFPPPGDPGIAGQLAQNRRFHDELVARGGKRYIIGAIPDLTPQDWRRHFGPHWDFLARSKARFDPDGILTPGQGIFA